MNMINLATPNIHRNPEDNFAALLDKLTDNDFGDRDLTIDQLLAPFSTLQRGRGERVNGRVA